MRREAVSRQRCRLAFSFALSCRALSSAKVAALVSNGAAARPAVSKVSSAAMLRASAAMDSTLQFALSGPVFVFAVAVLGPPLAFAVRYLRIGGKDSALERAEGGVFVLQVTSSHDLICELPPAGTTRTVRAGQEAFFVLESLEQCSAARNALRSAAQRSVHDVRLRLNLIDASSNALSFRRSLASGAPTVGPAQSSEQVWDSVIRDSLMSDGSKVGDSIDAEWLRVMAKLSQGSPQFVNREAARDGCRLCAGTGMRRCWKCAGGVRPTCALCSGIGRVQCDWCEGTGQSL